MEQAGLHASFTLIPMIVYGFNIIIVLFTNSKINDLTVKACYPIIQDYRIGALIPVYLASKSYKTLGL